jgi:hypothetical protein
MEKIISKKFDSMTIQLTFVHGKVWYEEISNENDFVMYEHWIEEKNAIVCYPWAF